MADIVNVINQQYKKAGCITILSFNLLKEKSVHFYKAHQNRKMVNVIDLKCNNISCQKRALYEIPGYKIS